MKIFKWLDDSYRRGVGIRSLLVFILITLVLTSCAANENTQAKEQKISEDRQSTLLERQPVPDIDYSLERENLIERVKRFNDPNKISYIYLMSGMGQIITFHTVRGKVSNVNSALTTPEQITCQWINASVGWQCGVLSSPQEDGSYNSNGDAIFFFAADTNTYVEWNGLYLLEDNPLQLTSQPLMIVPADQ